LLLFQYFLSFYCARLTHGHADAIFGLDDIRDLQLCKTVHVDVNAESSKVTEIGFKVLSEPMSIYLNRETKDVVDQCFSYLTTAPEFLDKENQILKRRVALLSFNIIDSSSTFSVFGLPIRSFPVFHGGEYISLGFSIGKEGEFVYISDVKIIPEDTMTYLKSIGRIDTLVLDAINNTTGVWSHMGMQEALKVAEELNPKVVYFTGELSTLLLTIFLKYSIILNKFLSYINKGMKYPPTAGRGMLYRMT